MHYTARAHTNIALLKYWGKVDEAIITPTTTSISLTLNEFYTDLWDIDIGERELKLIKVLKQIEIDYPEFVGELATIE